MKRGKLAYCGCLAPILFLRDTLQKTCCQIKALRRKDKPKTLGWLLVVLDENQLYRPTSLLKSEQRPRITVRLADC
jgi:hypothetical protein